MKRTSGTSFLSSFGLQNWKGGGGWGAGGGHQVTDSQRRRERGGREVVRWRKNEKRVRSLDNAG